MNKLQHYPFLLHSHLHSDFFTSAVIMRYKVHVRVGSWCKPSRNNTDPVDRAVELTALTGHACFTQYISRTFRHTPGTPCPLRNTRVVPDHGGHSAPRAPRHRLGKTPARGKRKQTVQYKSDLYTYVPKAELLWNLPFYAMENEMW